MLLSMIKQWLISTLLPLSSPYLISLLLLLSLSLSLWSFFSLPPSLLWRTQPKLMYSPFHPMQNFCIPRPYSCAELIFMSAHYCSWPQVLAPSVFLSLIRPKQDDNRTIILWLRDLCAVGRDSVASSPDSQSFQCTWEKATCKRGLELLIKDRDYSWK